MILSHIIIGILGLIWGSGLVFFAKKSDIPLLVRPFMTSWWIKDAGVNRLLNLLLGYGSIISGLLFLVGGIMGNRIWPYP